MNFFFLPPFLLCIQWCRCKYIFIYYHETKSQNVSSSSQFFQQIKIFNTYNRRYLHNLFFHSVSNFFSYSSETSRFPDIQKCTKTQQKSYRLHIFVHSKRVCLFSECFHIIRVSLNNTLIYLIRFDGAY